MASVAAAWCTTQVEESRCAAELLLPNANPKGEQFVSHFKEWLKETNCDAAALTVGPSISVSHSNTCLLIL